MRIFSHRWLQVACLALSPACSPLQLTVSNARLAAVSPDRLAHLLDAEADVELARGQRQEMVDALRASAMASDADADEVDGQPSGGPLLVAAQRARALYQRRIQLYLRARIAAQDAAILASQGRFELAKVLLLQRLKLSPVSQREVRAFDTQAKALQSAAAVAEAAAAAAPRAAAVDARRVWLQQLAAVQGSALSALGPTDVETQPAWELW